MSTHPKTLLSETEYLAQERNAPFKSEYYQGEMFAMGGATRRHNVIGTSLSAILYSQLRKRPCEVYSNDMRVRVSATGLYAYPDVIVVCKNPRFLDNTFDTLLNPTVLAEILSPATEAYDRIQKSEHYRKIESLAEYLLIAQDRIHVDLYTRQPDGGWMLKEASRLEDIIELRSIGCALPLADLYEKAGL
ncbi:MAG TPA: Uma2 family endonuclease [Bryobacteraceae bacterium]|nr:Uma2 family endonuclease [Bryobacteraceae bacterium]